MTTLHIGWTPELRAQHRRLLGRLTNENCRQSVDDQVNSYRLWAQHHRLAVVHVYPQGKTDRHPSSVVRRSLVAQHQVEIDPVDYVNWRAS